MYHEWARDFRCCKRDCASATRHLKNETLIKWYEKKTRDIKFHTRSMLAGATYPAGEHHLFDEETNMAVPNDLATMVRRKESNNDDDDDYNDYNVVLMTPRIAKIVAQVQQEKHWHFNGGVLTMYLRSPETRAIARMQFQRMFLQKFQKDLKKMPSCFKMGGTRGRHPQSPLKENAKVTMPWEGLCNQPTVQYILVGKDAHGSYFEKALGAVIDAAMDTDSLAPRLLIPCAENWPSWDAAVVLYTEEDDEGVIHIIFLQTMVEEDHKIYAEGLNQIRYAILTKWKLDGELDIRYHYVLVLLVDDGALDQIPKRKHVLRSSADPREDPSWGPYLRQYVMFVRTKELYHPLSQD
jgi:hypothetical protein